MQLASYRSPKTVVKNSGNVGRGLFAAESIARGEIVCVKGGHLIDRATLERHKAVVNEADLQIADDLYLAPLTAEEFESVMMFLNHSCEPNVGVQGQIVFVAMRDVAAGEELTLDYAMIDDDAEPMACRCGAAACRGVVSGQDWRRPELQRKYAGYFAWHLQRRMRLAPGTPPQPPQPER
jgi:SET domain-containing protein